MGGTAHLEQCILSSWLQMKGRQWDAESAALKTAFPTLYRLLLLLNPDWSDEEMSWQPTSPPQREGARSVKIYPSVQGMHMYGAYYLSRPHGKWGLVWSRRHSPPAWRRPLKAARKLSQLPRNSPYLDIKAACGQTWTHAEYQCFPTILSTERPKFYQTRQ